MNLCARLPLAVRIAGARLAARPGWPVDLLVERLADERHRLDELRMADLAVRASFAVSHHALLASPDPVDQQAAHAFRLLGALDWVDLTVPVAAAVLEVPAPDARAALERLVDDHPAGNVLPWSLSRPRPAPAVCPRARHGARGRSGTPRCSARSTATSRPPNERAGCSPRHPRAATAPGAPPARTPSFALAPLATCPPGRTPSTPPSRRRSPGDHRARPGTRHRRPTHRRPRTPLGVRGYWQELITLRRLAARTADQLGDRPGEALAQQDLGPAYRQTGRTEEAITATQQALSTWRELGDRNGEQACLNHLGLTYRALRRFDDAITCLEQAIVINREIGYRHGEASALESLGLVYQQRHCFDQAITCHQQALRIKREIGNRQAEAVALSNLGWAHHRAGQADEAISCFEQSLPIARDLGFRYLEAESLWGLGQTLHTLGDTDRARCYWQDSIAILRDIGELTDDDARALRTQPIPDTPAVILRNT